MPRRVAQEPVLFKDGIPSNFYEAPITVSVLLPTGNDFDFVFPTNEHYFQAMKVIFVGGEHRIFEAIATAAKPRQAKVLGRRVRMGFKLNDWNDYYALMVMVRCNLAKYTQHEHCREWLLNTGNRPLAEHRPDSIWGDNIDGTGMNLLGKVLELVRARVR